MIEQLVNKFKKNADFKIPNFLHSKSQNLNGILSVPGMMANNENSKELYNDKRIGKRHDSVQPKEDK